MIVEVGRQYRRESPQNADVEGQISAKGQTGMSLDLGLLAGQTRSCPSADISIKPIPHETCP